MASVTTINTQSDLDSAFRRAASDRLLVIDFTASWCGPCKMISPKYQQWSTEYRQVVFTKCDVDASPVIAQQYRITAMPTFIFIKNRQTVEMVKGANPAAIEAAIRKHAGPPQHNFVEGSSSSSSSSSQADPAAKQLGSHTSLLTQIDNTQTTCLNESHNHGLRDVLRADSANDTFLESDADEQLVLNIAFMQVVKIFALRFTTQQDKIAQAPKSIKIFANTHSLDFDEASSRPPTQELTLTEEQASGKELILLRYVKFQKANSLAIFIADNQQGEETTRLDRIEIFGTLEAATAPMTGLRSGHDDH